MARLLSVHILCAGISAGLCPLLRRYPRPQLFTSRRVSARRPTCRYSQSRRSRASADTNEQHRTPQQQVNNSSVAQPAPPPQELNVPAVRQPLRRTVNAAKAGAAPKHIETLVGAAQGKHGQESFEAQVRAALGSPQRTHSLEHQGEEPSGAAAPAAQPSVADHGGTVATSPPAATETRPFPAQEAPVAPTASAAVEIKSRPATSIESPPASVPTQEATGLSGLEQILRNDPLAATDDARDRRCRLASSSHARVQAIGQNLFTATALRRSGAVPLSDKTVGSTE
jgi:hypothetical protein